MPAVYNPFRYRGYYYDTETQLYYLQSRYYNPAWGRFLNADGYVNSNGDLVGFNMYAYCSNNPVIYVDYTGNYSVTCFGPNSKDEHLMPGTISIGWGGICSGGAYCASAYNVYNNVIEDVANFDIHNKDERFVLHSNYFSIYKGVPVIRIRGERSGSFGIIFLTYETNNRTNPEDVVRHEWGHTRQLAFLGIKAYTFGIAIPSIFNSGLDYYKKPFELSADVFGDVQSRSHTREDIEKSMEYLMFCYVKQFINYYSKPDGRCAFN